MLNFFLLDFVKLISDALYFIHIIFIWLDI